MQSHDQVGRKPLRLWPALAIVGIQIAGVALAPVLFEDPMLVGIGTVVGGALLIVLWWLLFSRAPWLERIGALVLMVPLALLTKRAADISIAGAGQGFLVYIMTVPLLAFGLVLWAASTRRFNTGARRAALIAALLVACAPILLIRTDGVGGPNPFHWRWTPTAEEILLAQAKDEPMPPPPAPVASEPATPAAVTTPAVEKNPEPTKTVPATPDVRTAAPEVSAAKPAEWPGFRGPLRDGIVRNIRIDTDWSASPPVEIWRRPVGPGWSSFAVRGDLLYTQEQRGNEEMVSCYRASTGQPVWRHSDPVRFYESNGGAGPRGTPTIHTDRVYAVGATGILKVLDAATGKQVWTRNIADDTKRAVPYWGIASSPLIVNDLVIVANAATLVAYDIAGGDLKWKGPSYGASYSSPHLITLDGVEQVVLLGGPGAISVAPEDGKVLWIHKWEPGSMVQPAMTEDGDILVNHIIATGGVATRRLHVTRGDDGWKIEERWTSTGLKPNFNDFVVHKGHAYGFDNNILASINLETGERVWKGGRYGNGQLVLLRDQDTLLVTSEDGELALVSATPDKYTEIAKMRIFEGKTWNHPVIVRDLLLVRNGEEMAAFRLPITGAKPTENAGSR